MYLVLFRLLPACSPATIEVTPFEGPDGVASVVTENAQVLVATTHLQVRNAPGPGKRFGDHATAIGTHLYENTPPGWLGTAFRNEGQLHWWTLSVWESEAAMLDFVTSQPHAAAMADLSRVSVAAESRSEWMATEDAPPDWDRIVEDLVASPGFEFQR